MTVILCLCVYANSIDDGAKPKLTKHSHKTLDKDTCEGPLTMR